VTVDAPPKRIFSGVVITVIFANSPRALRSYRSRA
jgi:hypothetical protein